jgi:hypothetical protein
MLVDYYKAALLTRRTDLAGPEQRLAVLSTAKVSPVQSSRPSRPSLVSAAPCATDVNEVMAWLQRCCGMCDVFVSEADQPRLTLLTLQALYARFVSTVEQFELADPRDLVALSNLQNNLKGDPATVPHSVCCHTIQSALALYFAVASARALGDWSAVVTAARSHPCAAECCRMNHALRHWCRLTCCRQQGARIAHRACEAREACAAEA